MFRSFPISFSVLLIASSPISLLATEKLKPYTESMHSHTLDRSVATGSALATDVEKIPGNVSIINAKQIQNMPNSKIADTIKKLAGVRVDNDVSFNPRPKIKIRGINYGTLLMLDGIILSDLEGESRILNQISLYDIERVEVTRGTFSSLYGAGAIGGVVNFITSMPTSFSMQSVVGVGNDLANGITDISLTKAYMNIGNAFFDKRLRVKFSGGLTSSYADPGFPTIIPAGTDTSNINGIITDKAGNQIIGNGGVRNFLTYDVRLKAEYDVNESGILSSMISLSSHKYTMGNYKSFITDKTSGQNTHLVGGKDYFVGSGLGGMGTYTHLLGNLTYQHDFGDSYLKISYSTMNLFSQWQDALQGVGDRNGGSGTTQDIDSTSNYFDTLYHIDLNDQHHLATAVQLRYYKFTQFNRNMTNWKDYNTRTDTYRGYGGQAFVASTYVSLDSEWLPNLSSTLGARYDYWLNFDGYLFGNKDAGANHKDQTAAASILSPKASINYRPDSETLRGFAIKSSIGSGFRMPTVRDMYQFTHSTTHWAINPNLKQEDALSFDIGMEYDSHMGFMASLYYYDTELWNMIYRAGSGSASDPYKYANAGRGRIHGIETSVCVPIAKDISIEGNYTLTLATILKNDARPETIGKQLAATPKHMANLAINYFPTVGFYASIWMYYAPAFYANDINTPPISSTYGNYDTQFTLNAKLGYNIENGPDISISLNNITDNRYYDFYRVAGIGYYIQTRWKY